MSAGFSGRIGCFGERQVHRRGRGRGAGRLARRGRPVVGVADPGEDPAAGRRVEQVLVEAIAQRRGDRHPAPPLLGLGRDLPLDLVPAALDADDAGGEVDVGAVQGGELAAAQPGVQGGRPQRAVLGAVKAAEVAVRTGEVPGGFLRDIVERVTPSVLIASRGGHSPTIEEIEREHVERTCDLIAERSTLIADRIRSGALGIVGAKYDLADGEAQLVRTVGELGIDV